VAQLSDLIARTRLELGDEQTQFNYTATGDGSTTQFTVDAKPIELVNLSVNVNGNPVAYPAGYTVEQSTGIVTFVTAPASGVPITISGTQDRYFLDTDITNFVNTAVEEHVYNRSNAFGSMMSLALIDPVEEYPVAILATIEALWVLATDSAFDINITAPDGVQIPRAQRYQQLTDMISRRWEQYRLLCAQLNIGLWKIEMGTLRRTSRTTNKLIPVYMPQEIDDSRIPERVYLENDLTGRTPIPSYAQVEDLVIYQGDSFVQTYNFPFDITNLVFDAQIRTYPASPSIYATFTITPIFTSPSLAQIQISLETSDTEYLPTRAFWDLHASSTTNPNWRQTYIQGQVFVQQEVTDSPGALGGSW
jgi:hypothetical protein